MQGGNSIGLVELPWRFRGDRFLTGQTPPARRATGWTKSTDFPVSESLQSPYGGGIGCHVASQSDRGSSVLNLSSAGMRCGPGLRVAVDAAANAYVTGMQMPLFQPPLAAFATAVRASMLFVVIATPAGTRSLIQL